MLRLGRAVLSGLGLCIVAGTAGGAWADEAGREPFELVPIFAADSVTPSTWPATSPATVPAPIIVESPPPPRHYRRVVVEEAPSDVEFARGHFELSLVGQGYTAYRHGGDDTIVFANVSLAYYVADGLAIGVEGGVAPGTFRNHRHHNNHNDDDGVRAEEEFFFVRWHFFNCGPLSLYGDAGLGGLHAEHQFPSGGREDNWLGVAGLGATWKLADHWYLCGGARYARLESGGGWFDDHHHHTHRHGDDGLQYYGGFTFIF